MKSSQSSKLWGSFAGREENDLSVISLDITLCRESGARRELGLGSRFQEPRGLAKAPG